MSVINRMLQDIDSRRVASGVDTSGAYPDIRSVSARPGRAGRSSPALWAIALLGGVCLAGFLGWREWQVRVEANVLTTPVVAQQRPATLTEFAAATAAPIAGAEIGGLQPVQSPEPAAVGPAPVGKSTADLSIPAQDVARPSFETLKLSLKLSALVADIPAVRLPATLTPPVKVPAPGTTTITSAPMRQVATDETVFAARTMWGDGAHAGALATLREALASAEATQNNRATMTLARELARLDVADNRAQDGLDLLKRLEPLLGEDADAWALRGNAEQRLAKHAEAAQSYLGALRMRPTEGKWMLGAAISLAASGKLDEAQIWVERARERDAVTPSIAAYLQQLGIVVRR